MEVSARRVLVLLFVAVGIAWGERSCNCKVECGQLVRDLRLQIGRLQAEVHALRGGSQQIAAAAQSAVEQELADSTKLTTPAASAATRRAVLQELADSLKLTADARRASVQEPANCGHDHILISDADVEALGGCRTVGSIEIPLWSTVTSLDGLGSLQFAEKVQIAPPPASLWSLDGLENLTSVGELSLDGLSAGRGWSIKGLKKGLKNLRTVGTLTISDFWYLPSLSGLEHLVRAEQVCIQGNAWLQSLAGLSGLETAGEIRISNNAFLSDLGLERLTSVSGILQVVANPSLQSTSGLESLRTVGQLDLSAVLENSCGRLTFPSDSEIPPVGFVSLSGLRNLETVANDLKIHQLNFLPSLGGFEKLQYVGGLLLLNGLERLESLSALERLTHAGAIRITACPSLCSLHGLGALESTARLEVRGQTNLRFLGGAVAPAARVDAIEIDEASWPLCITPHERDALVSAVRLSTSSSIPDATWQRWDQLCANGEPGWKRFDVVCTKGQLCSFSLAGAGAERIFLSGRTSGCGTCPENHLVGNVVEDGRVYLGCNLSDEEAGMRSICRCSAEPEQLGPVGQLLLRGPRQSAVTRCARGHRCVLKLDGDELESTDSVVVTSSCDAGNPPQGFRATWSAKNEFLLDDPATWYPAPPTRYQVCWKAPSSSGAGQPQCSTPESGYFFVGEVELYGPYGDNYIKTLGEDSLSVPNVGFGTEDGDKMRLKRGACGEVTEESAHALEVQSSTMVFDFGMLTEYRVQGGEHRLCWCQSRNGVNCTAEEHFMAEAGVVQIECPAAQQLVGGSRCERCPAGTLQSRPSLSACTQCPVGRYSLGADECTECPQGTVAERPGSSACAACPAWASPDANAAGCSADPRVMVLLAAFLSSVGILCATLVHSVRRPLPVVDVSLVQGQTIVTTLGSHGLSNCGRSSFPATLHGTGHPGLSSKKPFRVRVKDAARLELLTEHGKSMDDRFDTSKGVLTVTFPHDLRHHGWPVPVVFSLPALMFAIVGLGVVLRDAAMLAFPGAAAVALAATAASAIARWRPRATPLERKLLEFKTELTKQRIFGSRCPKGPDRAVTAGQLHELLDFFRDFIQDRSAYYLDSNVTNDLTKASRLSYAELVGPGPVEWFVSHFWGTAFKHFCMALRKHSDTVRGGHEWTETRYWVCFCSNNQHRIEEEVGQGWEESSFYVTLRSGRCRGTCMVLDDQALPLTRIWCIFELLQTFKLQHSNPEVFTGLLLCTSSGVLNSGGGSVEVAMSLAQKVAAMDLSIARATRETDATMIQQQVVREMGSYDALNSFVRTEVYSMLMNAKLSANNRFSAVLGSLDIAAVNV